MATRTVKRHTRIPIRAVPRQRRTMARVSVSDALALWQQALPSLLSARGRPLSPKSIELYTLTARQWGQACPVVDLAGLRREHLETWLGRMRLNGAAPASVSVRQTIVSTWLAWCVERGMLSRSPAQGIRRVRVVDAPVKTFTDAEVRRLLQVCDQRTWLGSRNHAIVSVLLGCGWRATELCNLDTADYDSQQSTLTARHRKGGRTGVVGVPQGAAASLSSWLLLWHTDGPLFPSEREGRLSRNGLQSLLRSLGRRAGVDDVHCHRMRHHFAVSYLRAGGDVWTLSRLLGHADIGTTQRYLRAWTAEDTVATQLRVLNARR
jgi:site-specific recombinase XerD